MGGRTRIGTRTVAVALWGLLMVGANLGQSASARGAGAHGSAVAALTSTGLPTVTASVAASTTATATIETGGTPTSGLPTATAVSATVPSATLSATSTSSAASSPSATLTTSSTIAPFTPTVTGTTTPAMTTTPPVTTTPGMTLTATSVASATESATNTATATVATATPSPAPPSVTAVTSTVPSSTTSQLGGLPLQFEANAGQTDPRVQYLVRGGGYTLFLTATEAVFALADPARPLRYAHPLDPDPTMGSPLTTTATMTESVVAMRFLGANPIPRVVPLDPLSGTVSYLVGSDPQKWNTGIATAARVAYQGVYPGIDLTYYGTAGQLEYDWDVAPGAAPQLISFALDGAQGLSLDGQGNLVIGTGGGPLLQRPPVAYQDIDGLRRSVPVSYTLDPTGLVGFALGAYDPTQPLVIDPVLSYGTYLGGSGADQGFGVAVDASGNSYVLGATTSANFPTTTGAYSTTATGSDDLFVTKLDPTGTSRVWSTYLGGSGDNVGSGAGGGIAVDGAGEVYLTGATYSTDFPVTANTAFQSHLNGGPGAGGDAFVTKLTAAGSGLVYSTYLGGGGTDYATSIAVDAQGNAYVGGDTNSSNFPTVNPYQSAMRGGSAAWLAEVNPSLSGPASLVYSTYLGGSDLNGIGGVAVDGQGNVYVAGDTGGPDFPIRPSNAAQATYGGGYCGYGACHSAFVAKLNPAAGGDASLVYSTFLDGSGDGSDERGIGVAIDAAGDAYVTGWTRASNFPATPGTLQTSQKTACTTPRWQTNECIDAFVAEVNPGGTQFLYATYLGGSANDEGYGIAVDSAGNAYVTGQTDSTDFPTAHSLQGSGGGKHAFVAELNPSGGALLFSSYLGGSGADSGNGIALDSLNNIYVVGTTSSSDFPTGNGVQNTAPSKSAGGTDAFAVRLNPLPTVTTTTDDAARGSGLGQFTYVGNWIHCVGPPNGPNCSSLYYNGTNSADNSTGDYATLQFSGSGIRYYATGDGNRGIAAVSIDGGPETLVDLYGPQQGNVLAYTSPPLVNGTHTLKVRVTGAKNPLSSSTYVTIDRVDLIVPTTRVVAIASGSATGASPYSADGYYSGGIAYATSNAVDTSGVSDPAPMSVYQSERYGNFSYVVPNLVPGASYTVRLHLAEIFFNTAGQRVFDVSINSQQVLSKFDIYAAAGAENKAIVEGFTTTADSSGRITIQYTSEVNNAQSNGVEIFANTAIDSGGGIAGYFTPDTDYSGGNTYANSNIIDTSGAANSAPQTVYQSERNTGGAGSFAYTIPDLVPGSAYTVRLHFAEIYWTTAGQRSFNVLVNGAQVLTNFDIYAAAGGRTRPSLSR